MGLAQSGPPPAWHLSRSIYDTSASCRPLYGQADADHDGLCDATELELAKKMAPVLKFPEEEPLLRRMHSIWQVHDAGHGELVVSYVQAYVADLHSSYGGRVLVDHPGDSEEVRYWVLSRDGGRTFKLVRAHYWHHTNGQNWAVNDPEQKIPLETVQVGSEVHPVIWVQKNAHGSYLDQKSCSDDPEGDGDACSAGFVALAAVGPGGNAGEPGAHILDNLTRLDDLGFPGEKAWDEKNHAFGVRGFCGGLPATDYRGTVQVVDGSPVWYHRRLIAAVCAGPLAAQWDRKPLGTEDVIYWQGFRSLKVGPENARPAAGSDRLYFRAGDRLMSRALSGGTATAVAGVKLAGDPAAAGTLLAYLRAGGGVVVRTPDGVEHPTGLSDPEIALAVSGTRVYVVGREKMAVSRDGGATFARPEAVAMDTRQRPAAAVLGDRLLVAWRTPRGELHARLDGREMRVAARTDVAPWAVVSAFDGGSVYLFSALGGVVRYHKISVDGKAAADPVEIEGAHVRSGGAAAALQGERLVLAHDGDSGIYVRFFDPAL